MIHALGSTLRDRVAMRRAMRRRVVGAGSSMVIEPLEPRQLLSAAVLGDGMRSFTFDDADGDRVTVRLSGEGTATIMLDGDATGGADIDLIKLTGTTDRSSLSIHVKGRGTTTVGAITGDGSLKGLSLRGVTLDGAGVALDGSLRKLKVDRLVNGADVLLGEASLRDMTIDLLEAAGVDGDAVTISTPGGVKRFRAKGAVSGLDLLVGGDLRSFTVKPTGDSAGDLSRTRVAVAGEWRTARVHGQLRDGSLFSSGGDMRSLDVRGAIFDSLVLVGAMLDGGFDLTAGRYAAAGLGRLRVNGDVFDSVIAAGGDPGADGLFEDGEVLDGGHIDRIDIAGKVIGADSPHINPGIYAAQLKRIKVAAMNLSGGQHAILNGLATVGSAVIDPLPTAGNELTAEDMGGMEGIETIVSRAAARARQLGVNATISIVDREGNVLAVVRTTIAGAPAAATDVDIAAGGSGGLEIIDVGGAVLAPASLASISKAGTAAFLSTTGNAFSTRTAGYIIQRHFPPGVEFQDSGPLYGVQFSSLPTSDINRLPLGLSADPGGLPLYRMGELVGAIGVEVDGVYTVDPSGVGGRTTIEEQIALAGQINFREPKAIRADRVFVDGLRLDYANGSPPREASLAADLKAYDDLIGDGELTELFAPVDAPMLSKFIPGVLMTTAGPIVGEIPADQSGLGLDFSDGAGTFTGYLDGVMHGGEFLSAAEVTTILEQSFALNSRLRAQIRKDRPQVSNVSVAVVDLDGNVLGVFRSADAPVFGYDVSVQKARTAAFYSRPEIVAGAGTTATASGNAGDELRGLDGEIGAGVLTPLVGVADPFTRHADAAAAIGVDLDGTVAVADRTGGFLSRDRLPDGIPGQSPGPFSTILPGDAFSPFNTGLQTALLLPNLATFLLAFDAERMANGEPSAIMGFIDGTLAGGGVGGGVVAGDLPGLSLNNGMQIFAGSIPLYEGGRLVGAVGVSGDGIEQDDFIAFAGGVGFQEFGDVRRADTVHIAGDIRLPYVKFPRTPFGGL